VTSIEEDAFFGCIGLTSIAIPNGVTSIGIFAFYGCEGLTSITIPDRVANIGAWAFDDCEALVAAYYGGTQEDRENIDIVNGNDSLTSATWYYYSETQPTEEGNYWHYVEGEIEVWEISSGDPEPSYSQGLSYKLLENDTYEVAGIGTCTDTVIAIPPTYEGKPVTGIAFWAFNSCVDVTSIRIPASVMNIEEGGLSCSDEDTRESSLLSIIVDAENPNYKSVGGVLYSKDGAILYQYPAAKGGSFTIPDSVTTIAGFAFFDCVNVTSITIPAGVTSIGLCAFADSGLTVIDFAEGSLLTTIGESAFGGCGGLTEITIPAKVTSIEPGALDCRCGDTLTSAFVSIFVDDNNTTYSSLNGVLYSKDVKTLILYPTGKAGDFVIPSGVTNVADNAFYRCMELTSVRIPTSVEELGVGAFILCEGLLTVSIAGESALTCIPEGAFQGCNSLTTFELPDSVTLIESYAFSGCQSLTTVYYVGTAAQREGIEIGSFNDELTDATWYYYSVTAPEVAGTYWHYVEGEIVVWEIAPAVLYSEGLEYEYDEATDSYTVTGIGTCTDTDVVIPATHEGKAVTKMGSLSWNTDITSVSLPASITSIGTAAFYGCTALSSISIPSTIEKIDFGAFAECTSLNYYEYSGGLYLGNEVDHCLILAAVTDDSIAQFTFSDGIRIIGDSAFDNCRNMQSITIPATVRAIGYEAFRGCVELKEISFAEGSELQWIVLGAFMGCYQVTEFLLPEGLIGIGTGAFWDCNGMRSIVIPASVRQLDEDLFPYCYHLEEITVAEGNPVYHSAGNCIIETATKTLVAGCSQSVIPSDGSVTTLGERALSTFVFESVVIPECVTRIERDAFCASTILSLVIPEGVTYIGSGAFAITNYLQEVSIPASVVEIGDGAFSGGWITSISVAEGNLFYHSEGNCVIETATKRLVAGCKNSVIPSDGSVTIIGSSAFAHMNGVTEFAIPKSIVLIDMEAFYDSYGLATFYYEGTKEEWDQIEKKYNWDYVYVEYTVYCLGDNLQHEHDYGTWVDEIPATCDKNGRVGYYYCEGCGTYFDAEYQEIAANAHAISALGHDWDDGVVTLATCTEGGYTTITCTRCGDSYTYDETDPLGHDYGSVVTPATCTEGGYTTHTCSRCGDSYTSDATSALGHVEVNDAAVAPTCTETGLTAGKHCSRCQAVLVQQEAVSALGHDWDDGAVTPATCTEGGYTTYTCTRCGDSYTDDETDPLGHNYGSVVTPATCTEGGYTTYTCTRCGYSYTDDETDPLGHTEVIDAAVAATCTTTGLTAGKHCSRCQAVLVQQEVVSALGHDWDDGVVTPATCTEGGYTTYTCSRCGDSYTSDATSALGHVEVNDDAVAPTCTTTGLTAGKHCSRCHAVLVQQEVVSALGHNYGSAVTPATCTEGGYTTYTCTRCGDTYTDDETDPLGHNYGSVVTPATCTEGCYTTYTCTRCSDSYTSDATSALGHVEVNDDAVAPTCTETGLTAGKHCSRCQAVLVQQEVVSAFGHNYGSAVTPATCTEGGYTTYTCTRCGDTYTDDETDPLGHNYGSVVTPATCTEGGYTTYTCTRCSDSYTSDATSALGHLEVNDAAVAPTCTTTGLTAGKHCSRCHAVLVQQEVVSALGHTKDAGTVTTQPAASVSGVITYSCTRCGVEMQTVSLPSLPVLSVQNNALVWDACLETNGYQVSTDGGNSWTNVNTRSVALSSSAGEHTIMVRAINENGNATASFSYQTTAVSLSAISKSGRTASWTATARTVTLTVNGSSATPTKNDTNYTYTCPAAADTYALFVSAAGGYDSGVYYAGSKSDGQSITVEKLATPSLSASVEGVSWEEISGAAKYGVSIDGGARTETTKCSVNLSTSAGSHNVSVVAIGSNSAYLDSDAATYSYTTEAIALSDLSVSGRIVSWTATADDAHMTVYIGSTSQGTANSCDALSHPSGNNYIFSGVQRKAGTYTVKVRVAPCLTNGTYYYGSTTLEKTKSVTILTLSTPTIQMGTDRLSWGANSNADHFVDGSGSSLGTSTTANYSSTSGSHTFKVKAIAAADSAYVDSSYSTEVSYSTIARTISDVTFEGTRAKWVATARYVEVKEGSGSYTVTTLNHYDLTELTKGNHTVSVKAYGGYDASTGIFYQGDTLTKSATKDLSLANTTLTFEDQTLNNPYTTANGSTQAQYWTQQYLNKSNESWVATSNQMNSRYGDTSRVVNFSTSSTVGRFTYSTGSSLGLANSFSVRLGNYYTSYDIWYKIALIDTQGAAHYVTGATNKYVKIASTGTNNSNKVFTTVNYIGFTPIEVKAIRFDVYGNTGSSGTYCYLYLDDLSVSYQDVSADEAGQYKGDGSSYKGTNLSVSAGSWTSKDLTAGYANKVTFTLKNQSSSSTTYSDITLYDGDYMVATARYVLYASQSQGYTLLFNKCKVTKFLITAASAGGVTLSNMTFSEETDYEPKKQDAYRVSVSSGSTSIQLMGANELTTSTSLNFTISGIKQLQKYASDVSVLFSKISNVTILSATYSQSIDVLSSSSSTGVYGTVTVKYVVNGSNTISTKSVTIKRKDVASINNNDSGQSTREYYARNLYKDIAIDPHGVILCGSSSMEKWETYSQDMKGINVADVGIGGTASTDWTADGGLAERLIYAYNPSTVILFVGVNDLKYNSPVSTTLSNVKTLIQQIHTNLPNAKVYYLLINKVPLSYSGSNQLTDANVASFNSSMKSYASSYSWLTTIALDTTYRMVYSGSGTGDLTSFADSMHLNKAGYTEWAYVIRKTYLEND